MSAQSRHQELINIIEQAIFETGTGLEAAALAAERILDSPEMTVLGRLADPEQERARVEGNESR